MRVLVKLRSEQREREVDLSCKTPEGSRKGGEGAEDRKKRQKVSVAEGLKRGSAMEANEG
ncbi:hypothetical protein DACRYDRAFT_112755 [Dacryopinax primogenitus]|uniref:Uncharacterized protein n=1 Tax=Dacryopinax primogenitus (strain DJM 731) TaxID=1858805 RepID=M5FPH7_DACPD|nr:uncharacterized protein DACRYDRAFT_112755 [Dacryopinax primogenitus]EJT96449.1 hypothetical protein DACRYDRAFT_112755 [Dacryopinax primogenitus]